MVAAVQVALLRLGRAWPSLPGRGCAPWRPVVCLLLVLHVELQVFIHLLLVIFFFIVLLFFLIVFLILFVFVFVVFVVLVVLVAVVRLGEVSLNTTSPYPQCLPVPRPRGLILVHEYPQVDALAHHPPLCVV